MSDPIFPVEWWRLPENEYNESKMALTAFVARDMDSGTKEVVFYLFIEREVETEAEKIEI